MLHYDRELLESLRRIYGSSLNTLLDSLEKPPQRYYFRVNVLKEEPGRILDELRLRGIEVYRDEDLEEALWTPIKGPNKLPSDVDCRVVVDKRTAESVLLGANVYRPGIISVDKCVKKGEEVLVSTEDSRIIAYGVAYVDSSDYGGRGLGVKVITSLYTSISLRDTSYYSNGSIYEQALPSMYVAHVLDPEPNTVVVDMCAAPGGKTSHVYELVKGRAKIYAFDHSKSKIKKLRWELARLGHRGIRVARADSRYLDKDYPQLKPDYIILDPPCSSLGVIPKVSDSKRLREIRSLSDYQRQFLRTAARMLKPCGILVYSTCTLTIEENEDNMVYATEVLGFEIEYAYPMRGARGVGIYEAQRFHPNVHGLPGYFIARLRRKC